MAVMVVDALKPDGGVRDDGEHADDGRHDRQRQARVRHATALFMSNRHKRQSSCAKALHMCVPMCAPRFALHAMQALRPCGQVPAGRCSTCHVGQGLVGLESEAPCYAHALLRIDLTHTDI